MELLQFKNWLVESYFTNEMATLNFGGHRGKDHTEAPTHYLQWMRDQTASGQGNFNLTDRGRKLANPEIISTIDQELAKRNKTPLPQPVQAPTQTSTEVRKGWVWAKSIAAKPEYELPAPNLDLAMRQYDANNWMFVILDPEEGRLVSRGLIPIADLRNVVKRQTNAEGKTVEGSKPSEILKAITPKKEHKGNIIPDKHITAEQKAIEERFSQMLTDSKQSHMMINALAGTGKSSTLKHLAWKFSQGKKWLYLVFNTINKEEAKSEFPPNVQVETTNGFAGREVLGKNHLNPTDRIQDYSTSDKARLVADSDSFLKMMQSLKIPNPIEEYGSDPKRLGATQRSLWYLLRGLSSEFKMEAIKLLGLAKSYAVDPRNESQLENNLKAVMDKYDLNTSMEDTKERVQKNSPWAAPYLNQLMGEPFLNRDFTDELMKATIWLMQQVMPHASKDKFVADKGNFKDTEQDLGTKRDFDDDLWFSAIHAEELNWPKYDVVLADEVQDFNIAQQIMLKKLAEKGAKIVAVGDPNQCHPAGTMISLTGGTEKPIEEVKAGDEVVTYFTKKDHFTGVNVQGRKVLEAACRPYVGDMIEVTTKSKTMKCTPNHRCLVKFINNPEAQCLYLMIKDKKARVGICPISNRECLGITTRVNQERADKAWILDIYESRQKAQIAEIKISQKYQLPQLVFFAGKKVKLTQEALNEIYEDFGDLTENARACLKAFGREEEFPFWSKGKQERNGGFYSCKKSFVTQASNLISGHMQMRVFQDKKHGGEWETIHLTKEQVSCPVYSLSVEPTELGRKLYIANGIVVLNSIYRFRGSDSTAFSQLKNTLQSLSHDKNIEHSLTSNFRSRKAIIDFTNKEGANAGHVSNLVQGKQFKEGPGKIGQGSATQEEVSYDDAFDILNKEMKDMGEVKQTAFLARTNEPLVHASLRLMKQGTPFVILGKDIANDLNKHIDKIINLFRLSNNSSVQELHSSLSSYLEEQVEQHSGKAAMAAKLKQLRETTEAMSSSLEQYTEEKGDSGNVYDFRMWLRDKFGGLDIEKSGREGDRARAEFKKKVEEQNPVILSTVHKSKGLQFQRVYILRDDQWPHPNAKRPEDLDQEQNNRYIGRTRAEDSLDVLKLKGQPGYRDPSEQYG